MKKLFVLFVVLGCAAHARSQNLVPNGSFEEYTECPFGATQIEFATGWMSWYHSPDYFHECCETVWADVPLNWAVEQLASNGAAYCGISAFSGTGDYAEIVATELEEPLVPGLPVFVSFKVAVGVGGTTINGRLTCNRFGGLFTTEEQSWTEEFPFPNRAHLEIAEPLSTLGQWTTVSGYFVPDSAYRFLSIGRHFEVDSTSVVLINPGGNSPDAYFLVDEVCVAYDAAVCGIAQHLVERGLERVAHASNPFNEELHVWLSSPPSGTLRISLFDAAGRIVLQQSTTDEVTVFMTADLQDGLYVLHLNDERGSYPPVRVMHQSL